MVLLLLLLTTTILNRKGKMIILDKLIRFVQIYH